MLVGKKLERTKGRIQHAWNLKAVEYQSNHCYVQAFGQLKVLSYGYVVVVGHDVPCQFVV
jgi:hypothetical protein